MNRKKHLFFISLIIIGLGWGLAARLQAALPVSLEKEIAFLAKGSQEASATVSALIEMMARVTTTDQIKEIALEYSRQKARYADPAEVAAGAEVLGEASVRAAEKANRNISMVMESITCAALAETVATAAKVEGAEIMENARALAYGIARGAQTASESMELVLKIDNAIDDGIKCAINQLADLPDSILPAKDGRQNGTRVLYLASLESATNGLNDVEMVFFSPVPTPPAGGMPSTFVAPTSDNAVNINVSPN